MDIRNMGRIPVDPRVIEKIQRSPTMAGEQGGDFMQGWGGPSVYQTLAALPKNDRMVYAAVLDGTTTSDQIEIVTGLSTGEVSKSLNALKGQGLVSVETGAPTQIV